eukprot:TRINITY_DN3431_c1_g1_i10.p5 TRINITY_DN3431_c1_g1~~TRINITY_DN3431_c1_g1_i10.p5  ORF type:complete len:142 (+),score=15.39 TRINITY_DN3431_c1_g1_i10:689-1114(+)
MVACGGGPINFFEGGKFQTNQKIITPLFTCIYQQQFFNDFWKRKYTLVVVQNYQRMLIAILKEQYNFLRENVFRLVAVAASFYSLWGHHHCLVGSFTTCCAVWRVFYFRKKSYSIYSNKKKFYNECQKNQNETLQEPVKIL